MRFWILHCYAENPSFSFLDWMLCCLIYHCSTTSTMFAYSFPNFTLTWNHSSIKKHFKDSSPDPTILTILTQHDNKNATFSCMRFSIPPLCFTYSFPIFPLMEKGKSSCRKSNLQALVLTPTVSVSNGSLLALPASIRSTS
jgi:hypothetical protein